MDALLATGDGKSPPTAFLVQGINEEYLLGGVYDIFIVDCPDGERSVYFDATAWGPEPTWRLKSYRPEPPKSP